MSEVAFLVKLRDSAAMIMDACETRLEQLAPVQVKTKTVPEETFFNLAYEIQTSDKLGMFDTADRQKNDETRFQLAFSILKANESTISKRFYGLGYLYSYWIFGEKIYRQTLKK